MTDPTISSSETPAELVARHDREFAEAAAHCEHRWLHEIWPGPDTHQCWACTACFYPAEAARLIAAGSTVGLPPPAADAS